MSEVPTGAIIEQAVRLAGRAPSLHNSQPWRWGFDGGALRLYAVPERMLPATDHSGRQLYLSCGIALGHLRTALAAHGWRARIAYLPNPTRREHLATVTFEPALVVTEADRDRSAAIERRYTDRLPFLPPPGWEEFETVLRAAIGTDAHLTVFPEGSRPELEHAARLATALRRYDAVYQAELQWWTGHSGVPTGVPGDAMVTVADRDRVGLARRMPAGTVTEDPQVATGDADRSTVLVLSTPGDGTEELLRCGQALSNVLLECTAAGYATCPVTNVTELPRSRDFVQALTGSTDRPQVLVRVGVAPEHAVRPEPTRRLALRDIFDSEPRSHH